MIDKLEQEMIDAENEVTRLERKLKAAQIKFNQAFDDYNDSPEPSS